MGDSFICDGCGKKYSIKELSREINTPQLAGIVMCKNCINETKLNELLNSQEFMDLDFNYPLNELYDKKINNKPNKKRFNMNAIKGNDIKSKFIFSSDEDGHFYLIPLGLKGEFDKLISIENSWELNEWQKFEDMRIDYYGNYCFENPKLINNERE